MMRRRPTYLAARYRAFVKLGRDLQALCQRSVAPQELPIVLTSRQTHTNVRDRDQPLILSYEL